MGIAQGQIVQQEGQGNEDSSANDKGQHVAYPVHQLAVGPYARPFDAYHLPGQVHAAVYRSIP